MRSLENTITHVGSVYHLIESLQRIVHQIQNQLHVIVEPTVDAGLVIHLAFLVESLLKKEPSRTFVNLATFQKRYRIEMDVLRTHLLQIEKNYQIKFSEDEIAYLTQMFLENKRESELDEKLPFFLDERIDFKTRKQMAQQLRRIRNKIAHGDFKHFNNEIEKYAQKFLDGKLYYDYTEYSRQNWVLLSICCTLKDALALIIYYLLFKREDLDYLKKEYKNESTNN